MKKIKQNASFLTKILLVVGLLISNLSSLSVVFAYEASDDVVIELVNNVLEINYTEELDDEVENVEIRVYENYTYLNELSEKEEGFSKVYSLTAEELEKAYLGELELLHDSIFIHEEEEKKNFELFDGVYNARVEIVDTTVYPEETVVEMSEEDGVVLAIGEFEKEFTYEEGLNIKVFDSNDTEISLVDGSYSVFADNSKVKVVAQILSGGLNPDDLFEIEGEEYFASDLLAYEFSSVEKDFAGLLFGEYELPVSVKIEETGSGRELVYDEILNISYEDYSKNADELNDVAAGFGYNEVYLFETESENGTLYVIPSVLEEDSVVTKTMLDLYNILEEKYGDNELVTYTLLKNGINILESFDVNGEQSLEEYLTTIVLDETVEVVLSNEGLTLTFGVFFVADINNDTIVDENDVLELIENVVAGEEVELEKNDLYGDDEEVNSLDVLYLNQAIKTNIWDVEIVEEVVSLDARLDVMFNGESLSEENYLLSGDEFTVDYVLTLKDYEVNGVAGLFNYDKELFELISLEINNEWIGSHKDGKFLYLGEESLAIPEDAEEETVEYVILTATFKALQATTDEDNNVITLEEIELFNSNESGVVYYVLDNDTISTEMIEVSTSDDNTLSYLEVAGVEIELQDGVFEYEITVSNDVTLADLKYILNNVAANVTLTKVPETLVEGENEIIITVVSESGISQEYKITVIREELVIEEPNTQTNYENNYADDDGNQDEEIVVTELEEDDDDEDDEKSDEESNLSRIVIIILILLVIAGLVYLIFKDEDDEETKKANKEVNKLKKESITPEIVKNTTNKPVNNKTNNTKKNNSNSKNSKKER